MLLQPASQLVLICCADPTSLQETRATFQFASQIVALRDNNKSSTVLQALRAESFLNRTALEQKENQLVSVKENMLQMQCPLASNKRRRRLSLCGHNDCNTPPQKMVRRTDCAPHSDPEHKARRPAVTASLSPVSELALVREAHAVQQKMVIAAAKFHAEQHTSLLEEKNQEIVALKKNALKNFAGDDIRLSSGQQAFTPQRLGNYTATTAVAPGTEPGRDKKFLSPNSELSLVRQAHIIQKQRAGQQVSHYKEERNASLSLCETMSSSLKTLQEEYDGKEVALANATARFEELKADLVTSLTSEENAIQEQSRLSETLAKAQQDTALLKDTVATMATEKDSLKMQNADLSNALKKKAEEAEMMKTQQQQALEKALADNSNAFSNQLVTLEGKFASLTSEKSGLDRHNAELKEELNAKSRELESMKASVKEQLEQASSSSEQQLAERERLLTKSQKEVEDLERFLTEAVHDKADLSEIVDAMRNDLDIMRPKLAELERGLEEERAAHAALQRSYSTMVQEKKEIELEQSRLNQALAKANTRRDELVQEMASLKADRDTKIQDVNNDAKATRSQLEQATTKIADLERQLQKSKEVEGQVNREMDEFQAFHENSVNTLEKEIESKENEVAVLQKDVQEKNELITLLENRGVNSHEDTASLQMELEQAKEDANNLQVDLVASKEEMNSLQQRLVELKSEKESVVQQLESFTKRCTDLEASVASHAAEVEAMESLSKLKSEIELGLSSAQSNLQERDNQIASLQSQLKDAAQEKSDLVSSLEESKANALAEPQRLHLELQQSTENNERLQSNLAALTKEKGELQQKISEMRFEKEHLTQQLEESTKKCIDLEGRVVSLEKEIESLNAKSESHAEGTNVGDTEAIISEKDQEIAYLKDKAKKMKKESKSKDKLIAKLEGLKMTKEQLKTLKKIKVSRFS